MALRYLLTRMRTPTAAALRTPSVLPVSPAARYRRFCAPPRQDESHGKRILNVESATEEEMMREVELLRKNADEALARVVKEYNEKIVPAVMQEFYKRVTVIVCAAGAAQLAGWAISSRQTTVGPSE